MSNVNETFGLDLKATRWFLSNLTKTLLVTCLLLVYVFEVSRVRAARLLTNEKSGWARDPKDSVRSFFAVSSFYWERKSVDWQRTYYGLWCSTQFRSCSVVGVRTDVSVGVPVQGRMKQRWFWQRLGEDDKRLTLRQGRHISLSWTSAVIAWHYVNAWFLFTWIRQ